MKNHFFSTCLFASLLAASSVGAVAPISVAVLDFDAGNDNNADYGRDVATLLTVDLSMDANLALVERADLAKILSEQAIGQSGAVDAETAAKIGHLTGAQVIMMGRVMDVGSSTYLITKAFSTETSRVFGAKAKMKRGGEPDEAITTLAEKLSETLQGNRDAIIVAKPNEADLIKRLKQLTEGHTLPTVKVTVPEEHIGQPVPDPAAQTELVRLLIAAGFTVIDDKSTAQPDVEITGEAFSENGMRFRNLNSCTARVEVKVVNASTDKIIVADARHAVALDIAEHVAGKSALQKGAAQLAPDIIQAIVTQTSAN